MHTLWTGTCEMPITVDRALFSCLGFSFGNSRRHHSHSNMDRMSHLCQFRDLWASTLATPSRVDHRLAPSEPILPFLDKYICYVYENWSTRLFGLLPFHTLLIPRLPTTPCPLFLCYHGGPRYGSRSKGSPAENRL